MLSFHNVTCTEPHYEVNDIPAHDLGPTYVTSIRRGHATPSQEQAPLKRFSHLQGEGILPILTTCSARKPDIAPIECFDIKTFCLNTNFPHIYKAIIPSVSLHPTHKITELLMVNPPSQTYSFSSQQGYLNLKPSKWKQVKLSMFFISHEFRIKPALQSSLSNSAKAIRRVTLRQLIDASQVNFEPSAKFSIDGVPIKKVS